MQIYINFEGDDFDQVAAAAATDVTDWATEFPAINVEVEKDEGEVLALSVRMDVNKRDKLRDPLAYLYQVAKQYKLECVVGLFENDQPEDICYFGYEEGQPDAFEVGSYLGLKR